MEEYYARHLGAYYEAINTHESHNYYMDRAETDITKWIEYFVEGMAISFETVLSRMTEAAEQGRPDISAVLKRLDPRQRRALELFSSFDVVTAKQIGVLFGFKPRTCSQLCKN